MPSYRGKTIKFCPSLATLWLLTLVLAGPAFSQATRTWVSGVGDDANPCSRTAPCKTFAGAISKTAAGGEISVLDPGGYGGVSITKSITIDGTGTLAGILAAATNGVIVNAGATDRVTLRNLTVNGVGTGLTGVKVLQAGIVTVEGCGIERFHDAGIAVLDDATVVVRHTVIRSAGAAGVAVAAPSGVARVLLDDVDVESTTVGVQAAAGALVTARDLSAVGSTDAGISADGAGTEVALDGVAVTHNATGIRATGSALVRLTRGTVVANTTAGLAESGGGRIVPFVEGQVAGNPPATGAAVTCEISPEAAAASVACPGACPDVAVPACPDVTMPACPEVPACPEAPPCPAAAACPTPVCESPVMASHLGPCRRCKTKGGVTTCTGCTLDMQ